MEPTPDTDAKPVRYEPLNVIEQFVQRDGSSLYLSVGAPPTMRLNDQLIPLYNRPLDEEQVLFTLAQMVDVRGIVQFESFKEYNTAVMWKNRARFRVNLFRQKQHTAAVIRRIKTFIPSLQTLGLPPMLESLIMERRGLVLIAGPTGSGKSTTLAAMLEHRNQFGSGHILTIEDPIEFVLEHKRCIVNQRDVGIDTSSYGIALKNALRQQPDVLVIGEIRDRDTMENAIAYSETGHLCLATIHSHNTSQTIERVLSFFPEEIHRTILNTLSMNMKAILCQRMLRNVHGKHCVTFEIMLNQGAIRPLISEGKTSELRAQLEKNYDVGMCSFDQSLYDLYQRGLISQETAMEEADNPGNLRVRITQLDSAGRRFTGYGMPDLKL